MSEDLRRYHRRENMENIVSVVSNVGFPIFACVMMFQQQKELNRAIAELSATLKTIDARIDNIENGGK